MHVLDVIIASVPRPELVAWEEIEKIANDRYKVDSADESMFWRFAVVVGDGEQQLYIGREIECRAMADKFTGAFLDGAFTHHKLCAPVSAEPVNGNQNAAKERDALANGIYDAAVSVGMILPGISLSGPQLLLVLQNLSSSADQAKPAPGEYYGIPLDDGLPAPELTEIQVFDIWMRCPEFDTLKESIFWLATEIQRELRGEGK